jgi:DegV family protein with EDD domain
LPAIAIVTDTNASLSLDLVEQHHIYLVPQTVIFGDETLEAVLQNNNAALFARVEREGRLPTTATPPQGRFYAAYRAAFDDGAEDVICFCISSQVSATYESAQTACEFIPGREITIINSRSLTISQGFMVLAAVEASQVGMTRPEILALAEDVRQRTHLFAAVPTLRYLTMSGQLNHFAAGMASMLDIKPILTINDGRLVSLEKVRSWQKSWKRMIELAQNVCDGQPIERMAIGHVNVPDQARSFQAQVSQVLPCPEKVIFTELNPGMSPHSGKVLVGLAFTTLL